MLYCGKLSFQTDSARKFPPVRPSGAQAFAEQGAGAFQLPIAAEKHIQRGKTVLRPSVNADVRLGEQQHAGHTHAVAKMMKMCGKCGRACRIGGTLEQRLQRGGIGEQGSIAVVEVKQGVIAGGVGQGLRL